MKGKWGIAWAICTLLLRQIATQSVDAVELIYGQAIFPLYRILWDYTLGFSPIPWFWLLLLWLIIKVVSRLRKIKRGQKSRRLLLQSGFWSGLNLAGWVITLFLWCWGFNYLRPTLAERAGLSINALDAPQLYQEAQQSISSAIQTRRKISYNEALPLPHNCLPTQIEVAVRPHLKAALSDLELPVYGRVRVRRMLPKGILLRLQIAGIYLPFVGEGHIDEGLHPLRLPFTLAHEMAHGYGVTDEGECNFAAWLACLRSPHPAVRYGAELVHLNYTLGELYALDTTLYAQLIKTLPQGIRSDRKQMAAYGKRYPAFFPQLTDRVNDTYLKTQGVKAGVRSYEGFVLLAAAWRKWERLLIQ